MAKRFTLACLAAAAFWLASPVSAQPCPPFQVGNPNGNYVVPGSLGDIRYSGDLAMDAYVQIGGAQRPSVAVIHGGGWSAGSRVAHVGQILELLTRAGYNWFSLDYRLGGLARYEDSLADLRAALAFIRCRASDFGVDPSRLVLLGEDSGAHLAALLASERPAGVIGAVLIGGFYDLRMARDMPAGLPPGILERGSPLSRIATRMPPLFIVHGGADLQVPPEQARQYCRDVVQNQGRCQFVEVEGASHRSENWWPSQWDYKKRVVEWLASLSTDRLLTYRPRPGVVQKDIVFSPAAGLSLDAFVPQSARPTAAVIVVHGGGWEAGDKVTYVTPLFEPLARAGIAWFSIDYRLTPSVQHEEQLEDVRAALRFVRREHARFSVDPSRIFLLGESASGQMVTVLAAEDSAVAGVVSFYGVYDFPAMVQDASPRSLLVRLFRRQVLDDDAREVMRRYSPQYRAHKNMPPILLVNGTAERLWEQAQAFARRLAGLGVRHEVVALDGAPHGLENWEGRPEWMHYKRRIVEWIARGGS